jgi:hypothetical protein
MWQGSLQRVFIPFLLVVSACAGAPTPAPLSQGEALDLLRSEHFRDLDAQFSGIQHGYDRGTLSDEELRAAFRAFYDPDATLAPKYDLWVSKFPRSYVARVARGIYYTRVGMQLRGVNLLRDTPSEHLAAARKGL